MNHDLYKIKDHENIVKDRNSGAILFSDRGAADEYRAKKAMLQRTRDMNEEINTLKEQVSKIDKVESDVQEIKEMLQRILSK